MKLETGYNHPIEIRNYTYPFEPLDGTRILYISDLHYHLFSHHRVEKNITQILKIKPDILLLGGDYVDTPFGLSRFRYFVENISHLPVFAIAGNHDKPYLRSIQKIVQNAGATWLHNRSTIIKNIRIDGARPAAETKTDFSILCLHQPIDPRPVAHRYNLIFAGHLHGGQIVLWQNAKGLYPGRWIYPLNQLEITSGSCHYLISKGLGDTLPIRYNCRRDAILVTCKKTS